VESTQVRRDALARKNGILLIFIVQIPRLIEYSKQLRGMFQVIMNIAGKEV